MKRYKYKHLKTLDHKPRRERDTLHATIRVSKRVRGGSTSTASGLAGGVGGVGGRLMDLDEITEEVRTRVGETAADFYTADEVLRAINEAITRFSTEEKWPFLLTEWESALVADEEELDLPDNISITRLFNLAISGGSLARPRMLERVDPAEGFRLRHVYDARTSSPQWYYISRSNQSTDEAPPVIYTAKVIPTPDVNYDVEAQYMAVPTVLTAGSEEPMIPLEYQEAIVSWAAGKLFLKELGISQKASEQFQVYGKVLQQAREDLRGQDLDEVVAWGRRQPLRGYWAQTADPRFRTPQNLG